MVPVAENKLTIIMFSFNAVEVLNYRTTRLKLTAQSHQVCPSEGGNRGGISVVSCGYRRRDKGRFGGEELKTLA